MKEILEPLTSFAFLVPSTHASTMMYYLVSGLKAIEP